MAATTPRRGLRRGPQSLNRHPRLVLTTGEPAGIGPDLAIAAALRDWPCELVFAGDPALLAARARLLRLEIEPSEWRPGAAPAAHRAGSLPVASVTLATQAEAGRLDVANARYVLEMLDKAIDGCVAGRFTAMVTCPVQKSVINDAGIAFTGHTEYLAARCGVPLPVMLLVAGKLRVALATTHLPISEVPRHIRRDLLDATLDVLDDGLRDCFRLKEPRILVCGLNPHAGEGGH
ncbi:MAG: 4-hydroxythreonine-4-phosphate dehydrogenase PdxA, partial [Steroidobacteraceae bacterium]